MNAEVHTLRQVPLFAQLREGDLQQVSRVVEEQKLRAKTLLFIENAPYSGLHIIKSGRVKVIRTSRDREQILAILGPGEPVDPIPLLDHGNHSSTAKTMEATVVYRIAPDAAQALLDYYPPVLSAVLKIVSARLRKLAMLANDLVFKDVTARVCQALLQYGSAEADSGAHGAPPSRGLTRQELASLVGTSREVAWRAVKRLERDGLVRIENHQIVIVDPRRMAAIV